MHDNPNDARHPGAGAAPDAGRLQARRAARRRHFAWFLGLVAVAGIAAAIDWALSARYHEETDDAYVAGNIVQVAAQVPGTVIDVLVSDTQRVRAGQTLARLDDAEAAVALAQAQAQLAQAARQAANARVSNAMYADAVSAREADFELARRAYEARAHASVEVVSPEELARARAQMLGAQAQLAAARAQRESARVLGSRLAVADSPAVVQAAAQFKLAWRNLKRTAIVAPVAGTVAQRSVQVGAQVGPGVPLLSLIQLNALWIEANFKEGQIRNMRAGQPVRIVSDIYGAKVVYRGRVEGFSAGTGSAFSMLPSQNAAGNWIKVVQRVPVVVSIDAADLAAHPLRVGLSMRVDVDTRQRGGHLLDNEQPLPAQSTRVHDDMVAEAEAAAAAVIRANQ